MICYTRNFEDVILQRVFADIAKGYYLDVGASRPVNDNNTFALYQKGWRGVAIEPQPDYKQDWQQTRPEDVFLNIAAGSQPGQLTLQLYDHARQLSSGSPETLAHHWQCGGVKPSRNIDVPVLTLDAVIANYLLDKPLHLLSIDVEGMEHEVLKGLDLRTHRPWVVVLEATLPGTQISAHQAWEPDLLASDYLLVHFDGCNRFYLAHEQRHLLELFALPPNVWDGFVMAEQMVLQEQVKQLQAQLVNLQSILSRTNLLSKPRDTQYALSNPTVYTYTEPQRFN